MKQHLIPAFFLLWSCNILHGTMTFFLLVTCKCRKQRVRGVMIFFLDVTLPVVENTGFAAQCLFFFWITCVFFEISDVKKAALQSLSYSIFAKTSGHFRTFFGTYAESEKLEGTLPMLIWYVIAMKPLKV